MPVVRGLQRCCDFLAEELELPGFVGHRPQQYPLQSSLPVSSKQLGEGAGGPDRQAFSKDALRVLNRWGDTLPENRICFGAVLGDVVEHRGQAVGEGLWILTVLSKVVPQTSARLGEHNGRGVVG